MGVFVFLCSKGYQAYLNRIGKEPLDEISAFALQGFSDEAIAELDLATRVIRSEKSCH